MSDAPLPSAVPGRSLVSQRALREIVRTAALGSYGVTGLAEPSLRRLYLGKPAIRLTIRPEVAVDVRLTIAHGLPVAEVARQVDSAIRYALRRALGREIGPVRIHVAGLASGPFTTAAPVVPGEGDAEGTRPGGGAG
ncbi:MAG TPA: Asp23/Gls24 family envelope stress response protein [Patescibacteria group bacterium]|nr:Asp23/Gls24 family envelope stress response protein [Patescibacteria group bacterium]